MPADLYYIPVFLYIKIYNAFRCVCKDVCVIDLLGPFRHAVYVYATFLSGVNIIHNWIKRIICINTTPLTAGCIQTYIRNGQSCLSGGWPGTSVERIK